MSPFRTEKTAPRATDLAPPDIRLRLRQPRPVLLDGALGTELERQGLGLDPPLWSARPLFDFPDEIRRIHQSYAEAGSEILTANTFRTQFRTLARAGHADRDTQLTEFAVSLAREASATAAGEIWVAGSTAPLEDCYSPDLVLDRPTLDREHSRHAENLARAEVDLVLIETMIAIREAQAAASATKRTGLPFAVSFACRDDGCLFSGETLEDAVEAIADLEPQIVSVNCIPPQAVPACLVKLNRLRDRLPAETVLGAYANFGPPRAGGFRDACSPERFAAHARDWVALGAQLVGGCCGTTPDSIREIAHAFNSSARTSNR